MVLCLLALPIFAILGIFSIKYRKLTLDALDCIFRTVTLRKCKSDLDSRIRADLTGKVLKLSPKTASFFYKHYRIISWLILVVFLWSIYAGSVGFYNYMNYGNCNGPESTGFCLLDPTGQNSKVSEIDTVNQGEMVYPVLEDDDPIISSETGTEKPVITMIEFGCYACPYTKKAEPIVKEVLDHYKGKVNLQFKTFFIPRHNMSYMIALASNCAIEQGKYPEFHKLAFEMQENMTNSTLGYIAEISGMDKAKFDDCVKTEKYKNEVEGDALAGIHAGVVGTPTFFINRQKIVGPKPFKTFRKIIDDELEKIEEGS